MDQGTWLWKKRTSEKANARNDKTGISSKENQKEKTLPEKLACLLSECNAKDELVSSHSKEAKEAMEGWEKAEAEAKLRKQKLDEALQKKIAERERFYGELKDCVRQFLTSAKEEEDKRVNEAVNKATKELETKYKKLDEKYVETSRMVAALSFENSQLTTALQVKEKLIDDINEQMSKVNGEFQELMARVDLTEKEYTFMKSENQKLEKELQIRNKEIELYQQSEEASKKKNLENVEKIKKLVAECRRLRVLVRKGILGPTALGKASFMRGPQEVSDRRISFMIERVCDVEEENNILRGIASKKDEEVRSLRNAFALLASKLSQVQDQLGDDSKIQKITELINGFRSWASALLSQLEHYEHGDRENAYERRIMTKVSEIRQIDDFVQKRDNLTIISGEYHESVGKELVPFDTDSTENSCDWTKSAVDLILEQGRVSQRSVKEILEDIIRLAMKYTDTAADNETLKELALEMELKNLQESTRLLEEQIENLRFINEDLNKQLNASRVKSNELIQKITSLEAELEDKSHSYEQLEETYLRLQHHLERKELTKDDEAKDGNLFHDAWEMTGFTECKEKTEMPPKNRAVLDKVLSTTSDTTLSQRSSLRDCLAEDGCELVDTNSPKTKEIISTSEMKISSPVVESTDGTTFNDAKSTTSVDTATTVMAIVPKKKRGGGLTFLRRIFYRRKKGVMSKKKSRYRSTWQI